VKNIGENSTITKAVAAGPLKNIFEIASGLVAAFIIILLILSFIPDEIGQNAFDLLTSNLILTLIGAVVAPWLAKTAKDKVGLDISQTEIKDLLDGVAKAADLTRKQYDEMRDANGVMPKDKIPLAKETAFNNLKKVFGEEKYQDILKKRGEDAISKAIDAYVASDWQKRYPIEKEQVKELVKVAVNTIPEIRNWDKLDEAKKKEICDKGLQELKTLLDGVGIKGWGSNVLEDFVAAELNTR
jgi:hypothetical protein